MGAPPAWRVSTTCSVSFPPLTWTWMSGCSLLKSSYSACSFFKASDPPVRRETTCRSPGLPAGALAAAAALAVVAGLADVVALLVVAALLAVAALLEVVTAVLVAAVLTLALVATLLKEAAAAVVGLAALAALLVV